MLGLNISALCDPSAYLHPVTQVRLIETHISWVFLAGEYAYKIKKPVDLGFLDFSTLDKRRFCCEEEIRLNCRLAPEVYLDVVGITERDGRLHVGGAGNAIEWAVRMRAFPAEATLDHEARISAAQVDAVADLVAEFHQRIAVAPADSPYGNFEAVMQPVRENFAQIRTLLPTANRAESLLAELATWSEAEGQRLQAHIKQRKHAGFVRECHGDLHLGNIAWVEGKPMIFDGIEFNAGLRFIDVISEMAFLCMDLLARGHPQLAWRLLNRWLAHTGDYPGLAAFRFYLVYRALVRAKVACIRAGQEGMHAGQHAATEATPYLRLADTLSQPSQPLLLLMHGFSGSGKTWASQTLLERLGAIRLRADVERKRLFGLTALQASDGKRLYSAEATRETFARLRTLTADLLDAGYPVIVDATFLSRDLRREFINVAKQRYIRYRLISLPADSALLRQRIIERQNAGNDASEATLAVLEQQMAQADPLDAEELQHTIRLNTADTPDWPSQLVDLLKADCEG